MTPKLPPAPKHLSAASKRPWAAILTDTELREAAQLSMLTCGLEALDRKERARELLNAEGEVYRDKWGQPKPHPATTVERDNRAAAMRIFQLLGLQWNLEDS